MLVTGDNVLLEINYPPTPRSFPLNAKCATEAPGTQMSLRRGKIPLKHCKKREKEKLGHPVRRLMFLMDPS